MSWGVSPWVYLVWDSLGFLDWGDYFLPHFREIFNYYLLKYFLMVFLFSSLINLFLSFYLLFHQSYLLPPLFYYLWPPGCFLSHLLHCSLYIDSFLFLLGLGKPFLHPPNPCVQAIYLWFHFDFKILDHFHYHYMEFFIR